jgi:hypothetical protein
MRGKPDTEEMTQHKEVMELCKLHVEELEKLEKKRGQEGFSSDRDILLGGGGASNGFPALL